MKGNSLELTIRPGAQWLAQHLLEGKCGAAVVMNPQTGAVYVMASSPGFDPNLIEKEDGYAQVQATKSPCAPEPASPLLNRATQGLLPPGSIFKTITAAAALDDGVYKPDSTFYDPGYCTEYGKQVKNALDQSGPESFGTVNLVEAYQHSINAVFCNIGKSLGAKRILEEAKKFGFYSAPPLETPGNTRSASGLYANGKLFEPRTTSGFSRVDPGRLAFGQEKMLTTPLQMAMVASAIANKGVEMRPTLIKAVVSPGGSIVKRLHPHVYKVATKPSTAGALKNMMVEVVQAGTGTAAQIPAWSSPARPALPRRARATRCTTPGSSSSRLPTTRRWPARCRRASGRRLRRRGRCSDCEAADAGPPSDRVERIGRSGGHEHRRPSDRHPLPRALPRRAQARLRRDGRCVPGRGRGARVARSP